MSSPQQSQAESAHPAYVSDYELVISLTQLRELRDISQKQIAAILGIDPSGVSRYESSRDPMLSTCNNFIKAMGGHGYLVAAFPEPDGRTVRYFIRTRDDDSRIVRSSSVFGARVRRLATKRAGEDAPRIVHRGPV